MEGTGGLVLRNTSFGRYVLDCPSFFYPIIFKYGAVGCTRRVRIIRPWTSLATADVAAEGIDSINV